MRSAGIAKPVESQSLAVAIGISCGAQVLRRPHRIHIQPQQLVKPSDDPPGPGLTNRVAGRRFFRLP